MNIIEKTVRQFDESWDLRDPDRGAAQIGPDGYRMDYHRWRAAFPDGEVKVVNVITSGDGLDGWAVVELLNRGTQTGPFYSSLGKFIPTGRRIEVRYRSVVRVQDGKVVEGRDHCDSASIARQLGLVA